MLVEAEAGVRLGDGQAVAMGDGVFVVIQESEDGPQSVVLRRSDLEAMLAA
jgi:hypothetical protein